MGEQVGLESGEEGGDFFFQGRAEADNLTPQERGFKDGLLQGVLPLTQWTSAHLALFTAAELRDIGDTRVFVILQIVTPIAST